MIFLVGFFLVSFKLLLIVVFCLSSALRVIIISKSVNFAERFCMRLVID